MPAVLELMPTDSLGTLLSCFSLRVDTFHGTHAISRKNIDKVLF